ncbi:MAG: membrane protein insertase YidC [Candidatus Niyogibacteria bacterium]|nr:membrane protein insertase YidC [Candidatus Niyogibacteria bacterium]
MFSFIYTEFLSRPLFNALIFLISIMPGRDAGLAIIGLTVLIRSALFPLTHHSIKTQFKMKEIEPEIKELRARHPNKEEQAKKIMELYRQHGINPFSGFLVLFVQFPILIALYRLFWRGLNLTQGHLYSFIAFPEITRMKFLGLIDLGAASLFLAITAGLSQFIQAKLTQPPSFSSEKKSNESLKGDFSRAMKIQMIYVLPVFIGIFAYNFPAAVALYWTTTNIFTIIHEGIVRYKAKKIQYGQFAQTAPPPDHSG